MYRLILWSSTAKEIIARATIEGKEYLILKMGYRGGGEEEYYVDPTTKNLIVFNCPPSNMAATGCSKGIKLLGGVKDQIFEGFFKVKKALTTDEAIITAVDDNGNDIRDYTFNEQGGKTFMYEESLMKTCQKKLTATIEHILNTTRSYKECEIFEIMKDGAGHLNGILKDIISNFVSNNTQENKPDDSDTDPSLVAPYIPYIIGTVVAATVAVGAGVTWYCRSKNAKKAQLQKYIDEYEAERAVEAKASGDVTTENHSLLSSTDQGTFIIGDNNNSEYAGTLV